MIAPEIFLLIAMIASLGYWYTFDNSTLHIISITFLIIGFGGLFVEGILLMIKAF